MSSQTVLLELKKLQRVRFWFKSSTTCQMLSELLLKLTTFSFVHENRPRLGDVLMYGVGSSSPVILLELALCTPTVINVARHIQTVVPIRVCSSIYLDWDWYLIRFYSRVWGFLGIETSSLVSMTHVGWRHVLWQVRGPTWWSIEIDYSGW